MKSSKVALKRARPALGTIITMNLEVPGAMSVAAIDQILSQSFDLAEELELKFSKFRQASDVCRINEAALDREIPVSREFAELIQTATEFWRFSEGSFNPFGPECSVSAGSPLLLNEEGRQVFACKSRPVTLDLSGIAKGFIVDRLADYLQNELPGISGVINAGGDLRFFNTLNRVADIRLGSDSKRARTVHLQRDSLATSSLAESNSNPDSTTIYRQTPRHGLKPDHCVSVAADLCATCDALTKVGWFATEPVAAACAEKFNAHIFMIDGAGGFIQEFGAQ